jgi:caffeoyl-CoA O-methyltransferase
MSEKPSKVKRRSGVPKNFSCAAHPELIAFVQKTFQPEDALLEEIRLRAEEAGLPDIHVHPMDGLHLEVLARAVQAKKIVEIGTLGGYSGVRLLRGAGSAAYLHTFEIHDRNAAVAAETFHRCGCSAQVTIHLGPALEKLSEIEAEAPFDIVFIDADKGNYPFYLKWAARNLRVGGLVIADNTFAFGKLGAQVGPTEVKAESVLALEEFNRQIATSGEFLATILPTGEGLTLGVKNALGSLHSIKMV